ncbi:carcinoembryonic antigen-related cell adhesion molecule 6-like isoform X2 [Hemiscyllium ocellatum]|uniref:carcinoembryonic antigen-related cell adhesion molecule 6-like isoform X2 n=1 Tax=Hemiscyllium ocellatum TaxID=170820 RepID=UPI0029666B0C|nr:carcinoembryonic antigen-related cell adhesion molecule 6-like isoform X2 [Hemiscyllium ocellatum]
MGRLTCLILLTVPWVLRCSGQSPVGITVERGTVQSGVGWNTTLSVANNSELYSVTWLDPSGSNILTRLNDRLEVKDGTVYTDRVQLYRNSSLTISNTRLSDEGSYTVTMDTPGGSEFGPNTAVLVLEVYVMVTNVSIAMTPLEVFEGRSEVTLTCSSLTGSRVTSSWMKDGRSLTNNSRVSVSGNIVQIQSVSRGDAGTYSCTIQNPISQSSANQTLTVFYGPENAEIRSVFQSDCATSGLFLAGRVGTLTCQAISVPTPEYTWLLNGQAVGQGSVLSFSGLRANQTGNYTCIATNNRNNNQLSASTQLTVVGTQKEKVAKMAAFSSSKEKVIPWISQNQGLERSVSPTPVYSSRPESVYSSYPPSNGSMVASTVDGGVSTYSVHTGHTGQLSTLV